MAAANRRREPVEKPTRKTKFSERYVEHVPFIEHHLSSSLRKVLKFLFRSAAIAAVMMFSSITVCAVIMVLNLGYRIAYGLHYRITWFEAFMLAEAFFFLAMNVKYKVFLSLSATHLPKVTRKEFETIKNEFQRIPDMKSWIEGWFFGASWDQITREDFLEWTASQFFNVKPEEMTVKELEMANELCDTVSDQLPSKMISIATKPLLRKILLTLDPPQIYHRPVIYYCSVRLMDRICRTLLTNFMGFNHITSHSLPFYVRKGSSKQAPIVFFHGLGIGLTTYIPFVAALLVKYPNRNIILFEMPSIQMKLDENHVLPEDFAAHVADCLSSIPFRKFLFIGHSLGTACVRWMDLYYPDLVLGRIFVDPVVFSLWSHHIAHNALYREPSNFHEAIIKYIGMSEPGHATYLHRYFVWFQNTYFTEALPNDCVIFLSENDNIVDTPFMVDYLKRNPSPTRKVVNIKGFRHGQIMASPEVAGILTAIEEIDA